MSDIIQVKKDNSTERIGQLAERLDTIAELEVLKNLTIFVAGSYAREEASIYSDIDLFFILDGNLGEVQNHRTATMRAFARIIDEADRLSFPAFSNDGEFLKILERPEITKELGGRNDDYLNYFTARMLLLLESRPVYGKHTYDDVMREIVAAYFRDYTHHPKDFKPVFLINDIIRFWKTLCLNYEHKRNQIDGSREKAIKQKVKNFKLKFSRMLTCYGSIAAIITAPPNSSPDDLISLLGVSPLQRLIVAANQFPDSAKSMGNLIAHYTWFLEQTNVSEEVLLHKFGNRAFRESAFEKAELFGDAMFEVIRSLAQRTGYLRYLIV